MKKIYVVILFCMLMSSVLTGFHVIKNCTANNGSADWWDSSWQYRKEITIYHTNVEASLVNFPVLISYISSDFTAHAQLDGDDFAFVDATKTIKFNHEIESYNNATGELVVWVKIPSLSSTQDTIFYLYYGNPHCTNQQNVEGTWDDYFIGVWHMKDKTPLSIADSTGHNSDGIKHGTSSSIQVAAKMGMGQDFERNDSQYIQTADKTILNTSGRFTIELWFNPESLGNHGEMVHKGIQNKITYDVNCHADKQVSTQTYDGVSNPILYTGIGTVSTPGIWYHFAVTSDKGKTDGFKAYLNKSMMAQCDEDTGDINNSNPLFFGKRDFVSPLYFDGILDEIRISNIPRSSAWLNTSYNNQNSSSTFLTLGSEQVVPLQKTPGFEIIIAVSAIALILFWVRKKI